MKGKCKRLLCAALAAVTLLTTPTAAQAQGIGAEKIASELEKSNDLPYIVPPFRYNGQIDTKTKTITLYAGLSYRFRAKDFKEERATWKISRTDAATLKVDRRDEKIGAAVVKTKKAGKFTITALQGKKKHTYKVTVKYSWQRQYLEVKKVQENNGLPEKLTWEPMPGADGYIVHMKYQHENNTGEFGWKNGQVRAIEVLKGKNKTFYNIPQDQNWDIFWRLGWRWYVRAYKIVNGKIYYSAAYRDDARNNIIRLK